MLPELTRALHRLERRKAAMLQMLQDWPAGNLNLRPAPGSWSAAQVIDHIARVEDGILQTVKANLEQPHPLTRDDRVGSLIVRCVMRSPLKVKVPASAPAMIPGESASMADATARWAEARERWRTLLGDVAAVPQGGVFSHPRGGWFTLPQTVLFLRLHHEHHRPQLRRIRNGVHLLAGSAA